MKIKKQMQIYDQVIIKNQNNIIPENQNQIKIRNKNISVESITVTDCDEVRIFIFALH